MGESAEVSSQGNLLRNSLSGYLTIAMFRKWRYLLPLGQQSKTEIIFFFSFFSQWESGSSKGTRFAYTKFKKSAALYPIPTADVQTVSHIDLEELRGWWTCWHSTSKKIFPNKEHIGTNFATCRLLFKELYVQVASKRS